MLAALADLKSKLGKSGSAEDTVLTAAIVEAQALIERSYVWTMEYVAADLTEYFDGGAPTLRLKAWPVTSVSSVIVSELYDWTTTALIANTDYRVISERGLIHRLPRSSDPLSWAYWESYGPQTIRVVYRGGYWDPAAGAAPSGVSAAPTHIQRAILIQAAEMYKRRLDPGTKEPAGGPGGVSAGILPPVELLPAVEALLERERRW